MRLAMQRIVIVCVCVSALAAVGCADGSGTPTSPGANPPVSGLASPSSGSTTASVTPSFPRSGALHVTKDCPPETYMGQVGDFCTIASSNLNAIDTGSKITYAQALDFGTFTLDSDVVLDLPGPGNNKAFGHCHLSLGTGRGLCTFSGGTGKFAQFQARANVSSLGGTLWAWDGTYSFDPRD